MENKLRLSNDYELGASDMFHRVKPHLENYNRILEAFRTVNENPDTKIGLLKHIYSVDKIIKEFE